MPVRLDASQTSITLAKVLHSSGSTGRYRSWYQGSVLDSVLTNTDRWVTNERRTTRDRSLALSWSRNKKQTALHLNVMTNLRTAFINVTCVHLLPMLLLVTAAACEDRRLLQRRIVFIYVSIAIGCKVIIVKLLELFINFAAYFSVASARISPLCASANEQSCHTCASFNQNCRMAHY